jgi:hypothetical protein
MLLTGAIISLAHSLFFLPSLSHSELCHLASTNFLNQIPWDFCNMKEACA